MLPRRRAAAAGRRHARRRRTTHDAASGGGSPHASRRWARTDGGSRLRQDTNDTSTARVPPIRLLLLPESHPCIPESTANREDTQVENLCYEGPRGAARAREPALLTSGAMDGGAKSASSERSPGWAQRVSGDGHGQPRAEGEPGTHRLKTTATRGCEPREHRRMDHTRSSTGAAGGTSRSQPAGTSLRSRAARQTGWPASRVRRSKCVR